jgi:hypothetical protein
MMPARPPGSSTGARAYARSPHPGLSMSRPYKRAIIASRPERLSSLTLRGRSATPPLGRRSTAGAPVYHRGCSGRGRGARQRGPRREPGRHPAPRARAAASARPSRNPRGRHRIARVPGPRRACDGDRAARVQRAGLYECTVGRGAWVPPWGRHGPSANQPGGVKRRPMWRARTSQVGPARVFQPLPRRAVIGASPSRRMRTTRLTGAAADESFDR